MKKRVVALLMAAVMVAGLTACGGSGNESAPAQEPDGKLHENQRRKHLPQMTGQKQKHRQKMQRQKHRLHPMAAKS